MGTRADRGDRGSPNFFSIHIPEKEVRGGPVRPSFIPNYSNPPDGTPRHLLAEADGVPGEEKPASIGLSKASGHPGSSLEFRGGSACRPNCERSLTFKASAHFSVLWPSCRRLASHYPPAVRAAVRAVSANPQRPSSAHSPMPGQRAGIGSAIGRAV